MNAPARRTRSNSNLMPRRVVRVARARRPERRELRQAIRFLLAAKAILRPR